VAAYTFLKQHATLFGAGSPNVDFQVLSTRATSSWTHVRFQQTYAGIPVFVAQAVVKLSPTGGIKCVSSVILTDTSDLDAGTIPILPQYTAAQAEAKARAELAPAGIEVKATPPSLAIFAPSVIANPGKVRLVWRMWLWSPDGAFPGYDAFIDALDGSLVAAYPLAWDVLQRTIRDHYNCYLHPGTVVLSEGDPICTTPPCPQADDAYRFLGHAYDFFWSRYLFDSVDDNGLPLDAGIRFCLLLQSCPWANAAWFPATLTFRFGDGFAVDDVVGHEYTHGVTQAALGSLPAGEAGAISESLSDIFGEFIDQTNSYGDDSAGVKWLVGEELDGGALRSMKHPPDSRVPGPDRLGSDNWYTGTDNSKFIHVNCGVGNKLAFLLTDGQEFNGKTIRGLGIEPTVDLFFNALWQLTSSSAYTQLYDSLMQSASDLAWSPSDRDNLYQACLAVEIAAGAYVDGTYSGTELGTPREPFSTIGSAVNAVSSGDTVIIRGGTYDEAPLTINKAMTIEVVAGSVVIQ
jgi:Zn-dependent metalloprotease